jgi:predicted nucleic acid-binding protein
VRARYLADKSALARMPLPTVGDVLGRLLIAGDVATCTVVDLELLFSARNHAELIAIRSERSAFEAVPIVQADFDRAADVMEGLASAGRHRAAGIPDLLIAAVAERAGLTVLHYDEDFDRIAEVTGQPMRWVVPRGSV